IGNTVLFEQSLGASNWNNLAKDATFPEQEIAQLQKLPLFVQAMTTYIIANKTKDTQQLESIIHTLHTINFISNEEQQLLLHKSTFTWLSFHDLFGIDLPEFK